MLAWGDLFFVCRKVIDVIGTGKWTMGAIVGLLGLLGLVFAANAVDDMFYYGGLIGFAASVGAIFFMISRAYGDTGGDDRTAG